MYQEFVFGQIKFEVPVMHSDLCFLMISHQPAVAMQVSGGKEVQCADGNGA